MTLDLRRESKEGSEKSNDDPRKYLHVHVHICKCTRLPKEVPHPAESICFTNKMCSLEYLDLKHITDFNNLIIFCVL